MKKYYNFPTILAVVFAVGLVAMSLYATRCHGEGCVVDNNVKTEQPVSIKMNPEIIKKQVENNEIVLLDVREDSEWNDGHISGAMHIPLGNINEETITKIEKGKPLYVYCRSGRRAGEAVIKLKSLGFNDVTNLGGVLDWQENGGNFVVE